MCWREEENEPDRRHSVERQSSETSLGCSRSLLGENCSSHFSSDQFLNSFGVGSSALPHASQVDPVCFKSLIQQLSTYCVLDAKDTIKGTKGQKSLLRWGLHSIRGDQTQNKM